MFFLSLPGAIKLLPMVPRKGTATPTTITAYLHEFFPDPMWPYGETPTLDEINSVAARFARNSTWPTGNNQAAPLFFCAFFFLILIVAPVVNPYRLWFLGYLAVALALACLLTGGSLLLLHWGAAAVDTRLVKVPPTHAPLPGKAVRVRIRHGVFITYRREDTSGYAIGLKKALSEHLHSSGHIFMDIDIHAGINFVRAIGDAIGASKVAIVLISTQWLSITAGDGKRRLDDPNDMVRGEIRLALEKGLKVIPVLVGKATMPSAPSLPTDIAGLAVLNALEIRDNEWDHDLERLIAEIVDAHQSSNTARS